MILPENILLSKINAKNVYWDKKSKELLTTVIKEKYKLAGRSFPELDIFPFFILTTNQSACSQNFTIKIHRNDWLQKERKHLNAEYTFADITKIEGLDKNTLLNKIKDSSNKFITVAKLCNRKFKELNFIREKIKQNRKYISSKRKKLIEIALSESTIDTILKDLGLYSS